MGWGTARSRPGNGKEMKAYKIAMVSIAVVAMMCICPLAVMANDSDAYNVTAGESGLSVKIDSMSEADINKLVSATEKEDMAESVLKTFTSTDGFTIADVKITKLSLERGLSSKVTEDNVSDNKGTKATFTMTFTANATVANKVVFKNEEPFIDPIKEHGTNKTVVGDKFEVSAEVTVYGAETRSSDIVKNEDGNFVVTAEKQKQYTHTEYEVTAKYVYTKDAQPANFTAKIKATSEMEESYDRTFDFNGVDVAKVKADTKAFIKDETIVYAGNISTECTFNGNTNSDSDYLDLTALALIFGGSMKQAYDDTTIFDWDLKANEYGYVGTDDDMNLFDVSDVGTDVDTDAKMKEFLQSVGTVSESYDTAKAIADDNDGDVVSPEAALNLMLIIGIAAVGVIALLFLVLFILAMIFRRRKK